MAKEGIPLFFDVDEAGRLEVSDYAENQPLDFVPTVYARISTFDTFEEFMKTIPDGTRIICARVINPDFVRGYTDNKHVWSMVDVLYRLFDKFPESTHAIVDEIIANMKESGE